MMRRIRLKKWTNYIFILSFLFCSGCAKQSTDTMSELTAKDLMEPVASQASTCKAFIGDIINAEVLDARVSPSVKYLSFDESVTFGEYCCSVGDSVSKGSVIAKSYAADTENAVTDLKDKLQDYKDAYSYEQESDKLQLNILKLELQAMDGNTAKADYISKEAEITRMKLAISQASDLEKLEEAHINQQISDLLNKNASHQITAPYDGVVVGLLNKSLGDQVSNTAKVAALADNTSAVIQTKYLQQNTLSRYERVYALINGKDYAIVYDPYDDNEYQSMVAAGDTPVGNFQFADAKGNQLIGSYAVVVLVMKERKNVICIPDDAINLDAEGEYINKCVGGKKVRFSVKTGLSDGINTEIISGADDGDIIYTMETNTDSEISDHAVVKGSFNREFQGNAEKVWLNQKALTYDPMDNHITFDSFAVKEGDQVEAGDVVAYLTSENDDAALAEKQFEQASLIKKIKDLKDKYITNLKEKENEKALLSSSTDRSLKNLEIRQLKADYQYQKSEQQKELTAVEKDLDKMSSVKDTIEIVASEDCLITKLDDLSTGDKITPTTIIAKTADYYDYCLAVSDKDDQLISNMKVTLLEGSRKTTGIVISTWNASLPVSLQSEMPIVRVADTHALQIGRITAVAKSKVMDQVYMVDRSYLFSDKDQYYVKEVDADGRIIRRLFLLASNNKDYCFTAIGLDVAMRLQKNTE